MRNTLLWAILVALGALGGPGAAWADTVDEADQTMALPEMDDPLQLRKARRLDPTPPMVEASQLLSEGTTKQGAVNLSPALTVQVLI